MDSQAVVGEMLRGTRVIAVVGISDRPERASYAVAEYLEQYFEVIPVNPQLDSWKGKKCYPSVSAIPGNVDMVDVFRRSEFVPEIVEDAIQKGVKYIWLQQGVIHEEAKTNAERHGIKVVMDSCLAVVHRLNRP